MKKKFLGSIKIKVIIISMLALTIMAFLLNFFGVSSLNNLGEKLMGQNALNIANAASQDIDGDLFAKLSRDATVNDYYHFLQNHLNILRKKTGSTYLYSYVVEGNKIRYIVDGFDKNSPLFSTFNSTEPAEEYDYEIMKTKNPYISNIYSSKWGLLKTAVVPILNSKNEIVGLLGCDISVNALETETSHFRTNLIIAGGIIFIISSFIFIWYMSRSFKPFNTLIKNMNDFAETKIFVLDSSLETNHNREIEELIRYYHYMAEEIYSHLEELTTSNNLLNETFNDLEIAYFYFTEKLIGLIEGYDENTGNHVDRVGVLSEFFAEKLNLSTSQINEIRKYAPLHDIGKIAIPQSILNKPGKLEDDEWIIMQTHTIHGGNLLDGNGIFITAKNIALFHHEKYNGTGYPRGLKGDEIPIESAIVSFVDVYDALRSNRPYKRSFTHKEAFSILTSGDNRTKPDDFNPMIIKIFIDYESEIEELWNKTNKQ